MKNFIFICLIFLIIFSLVSMSFSYNQDIEKNINATDILSLNLDFEKLDIFKVNDKMTLSKEQLQYLNDDFMVNYVITFRANRNYINLVINPYRKQAHYLLL